MRAQRLEKKGLTGGLRIYFRAGVLTRLEGPDDSIPGFKGEMHAEGSCDPTLKLAARRRVLEWGTPFWWWVEDDQRQMQVLRLVPLWRDSLRMTTRKLLRSHPKTPRYAWSFRMGHPFWWWVEDDQRQMQVLRLVPLWRDSLRMTTGKLLRSHPKTRRAASSFRMGHPILR
jgi:hypothetical protein